jgi:hypothetical protein
MSLLVEALRDLLEVVEEEQFLLVYLLQNISDFLLYRIDINRLLFNSYL